MDLSIFGTDQDLEVEGVWHDIEDSRVRVARFNNQNYQKTLRRLMRPHQTLINAGGEKADEILDRITTRCMAMTILTDWENISDGGEALEYSHDNSEMMLKKYPDFRELIAQLASRAEHYRTHRLEQTVGNS